MYTLDIITPAASEPVTTQELKDHLRLNDASEDSLLTGFITTARQQFEHLTGRAVLPTTFRQYIPDFAKPVYLARAKVTSVSSAGYYDGNNQSQSFTDYVADLNGVPAMVFPNTSPSVTEKRRLPAWVEFVAGWTNANSVPTDVKLAIKLLAATYYANRESHGTATMKDLPMGFISVCNKYKTGMMGDWR